ncbi:MAG: hypothetical protein MJY99_10955 [Fibrobacter sp.]|nr:hypothetical protein [Fibrobacter sp.]
MAATLLESLKKTIGKKKSGSQAFAWLADLERQAGDLDTALQRVDGGLNVFPNDVPAMLVRSMILFQKEDYKGCVQECEKILTADPFCLSAHKRMGDAYDKLDLKNERNMCYRRVHDMDPLDEFWKDEYEENVVDSVAAAAMLSDGDFTMPEDESFSGSELQLSTSDVPVAEDLSDEFASPDENATDEGFSLESVTPVEQPAEPVEEQPDETLEQQNLNFNGADMPSLSMEDDSPSSLASPFSAQESEEDPFAAFASLLPNEDSNEQAVMDSLEASLNSALSEMSDEPTEPEEFPVDDEVSGSDVGSALSSMFGDSDDLEEEENPVDQGPISPFAQIDLPETVSKPVEEVEPLVEDKPQSVDSAFGSIFGDDELPEEKPQGGSLFEKSSEDKPQSVDSAFSDIFGEDELPEELPQTSAAPSAAGGSLFEKSSEDKPQSVDSAFSDIFGEDELPEELPQTSAAPETAAGGSLFEKSSESKPQSVDDAFSDIFGEDELPEELPQASAAPETAVAEETFAAEPALEEPATLEEPAAPQETLSEGSLQSETAQAFDALFEDELPEERPQASVAAPVQEKPVAPVEVKPSSDVNNAFDALFGEDDSLEELSEEPASAKTDALEEIPQEMMPKDSLQSETAQAFDALFEDELPEEKPQAAAPEAQAAEDVIAEPVALEEPAAPAEVKQSSEVDNAFDALFGEDEFPEEHAQAPAPAAPVQEEVRPLSAADALFGDLSDESLDEPAEKQPEALEETAEASAAEPAEKAASEASVSSDVDNAFASIFGDDDLPEESGEAKAEVKPAPAPEKETSDNVAKDVDDAFASIFGDDDLNLDSSSQEATGAKIEEFSAVESAVDGKMPSVADGNIESEVSSAFKGLFEMDDDSLPEEPASNSKGVDFLMSGDSDDEVSNGLINNPSAPLERGAADLDDSLNTKTLAEIYFEQGLYKKALNIYEDLARKEPGNAEIANRLSEVKKFCSDKLGE